MFIIETCLEIALLLDDQVLEESCVRAPSRHSIPRHSERLVTRSGGAGRAGGGASARRSARWADGRRAQVGGLLAYPGVPSEKGRCAHKKTSMSGSTWFLGSTLSPSFMWLLGTDHGISSLWQDIFRDLQFATREVDRAYPLVIYPVPAWTGN